MNAKAIAHWVGLYQIVLGLAELANQQTTSTSTTGTSIFSTVSSLPSLGSLIPGSTNAAYVDLLVGAGLLYYAHGMKL